MEAYLANLLRENSATTIVFVNDNAAIDGDANTDMLMNSNRESNDTDGLCHWTSSVNSNTIEADQSPILPTRKSCDSLFTESSSSSPLEDSRKIKSTSSLYDSPKNKSNTGSLYDKFRAFKRRTMKCNGNNKVGALQNPLTKTKKNKNRWGELHLFPVSQLLLNNVDPPTLPTRKESDHFSSSDSFSVSSATTNDVRHGCFLDNTMMIVNEHIKRHIELQSSLMEEALSLSDDKMRTQNNIPSLPLFHQLPSRNPPQRMKD